MTDESEGWSLTDAGRRAVLFVLRWYAIALVAAIVLGLIVGFGAGWWARILVH